MNKTQKLLLQARSAKTRRHLRMIRGRFQKCLLHLSSDLQESAMREFYRQAARPSAY
jgi:CRP-like cAMP-binding protein